jgi:hypothetical protein
LRLEIDGPARLARDLRGGEQCDLRDGWLNVRVPARGGTVVHVN